MGAAVTRTAEQTHADCLTMIMFCSKIQIFDDFCQSADPRRYAAQDPMDEIRKAFASCFKLPHLGNGLLTLNISTFCLL